MQPQYEHLRLMVIVASEKVPGSMEGATPAKVIFSSADASAIWACCALSGLQRSICFSVTTFWLL